MTNPHKFSLSEWCLKDRAIRHHINCWGSAHAFEETTFEQEAGREYIVIRCREGVMSVYRLRNDGALRRLSRWPKFVK